MRLKLDENVGKQGAELLRQAGHDIHTVGDEQLWGAPDNEIVAKCNADRRCLVTLDLEFGNPLIFNPSRYHGIAVLRLPSRPTPDDLSDAIRTLIGGLAQRDIEGRLWVVQRGRLREYQPEDEDIG